MNRLETIRQYFIERFIIAISTDSRLIGLSNPSELFDTNGNFIVTADTAGFKRIPTLRSISQRISVASSQKEREDLETFAVILRAAINQITGGLGEITAEQLLAVANQYAPQIRQRVEQTFVPMPVEQYLNFKDGTLAAQLYDQSGRTPLSGRIFDVMFENPSIPQVVNVPEPPYQVRVPFVATVGIDPSVLPFPDSPLSVGRLNLSAADARFSPGQVKPTLYAEIKALPGALSLNRLYEEAAALPGRFEPLRANRIHQDPLINLPGPSGTVSSRTKRTRNRLVRLTLEEIRRKFSNSSLNVPVNIDAIDPSFLAVTSTSNEPSAARADAFNTVPSGGPYLLVYHAFYPVDDNARKLKTQSVNAKNREGHHLATGILFFEARGSVAVSTRGGPAYLFICEGPDSIQMLPFNHPVVQRLNDQGEESPSGTHPILFTTWRSPLSLTTNNFRDNSGQAPPVNTAQGEKAGIYGGISALAAVGVGFIATGVGTVVGIVLIVIAAILFLICAIFGCGNDNDSNNTGNSTQPITSSTINLKNDPQYQDPSSYLAPPNTGVIGRNFQVKLIPHAFDRNLYGLHGDGEQSFTIDDDPELKEMLAWLAFPGGLGYPVNRNFPGKQDQPGSSWRNYFDLFTEKFLEVQKATNQVTYFGT